MSSHDSRTLQIGRCSNFCRFPSLVPESVYQFYASYLCLPYRGLCPCYGRKSSFPDRSWYVFLKDCKTRNLHSLAVLKINGEALLQVTDDGMFINLMRGYFTTIGDSAHPDHADPRIRAITNFQELLVVAFREFNVITDETITTERRRLRAIISDEIEKFSKRAAVRNLKRVGSFSKDQIGIIYDHYFTAVCSPEAGPAVQPNPISLPGDQFDQPRIQVDAQGRVETRIDLSTFKVFLGDIATWAREETVTTNAFIQRTDRKVADHELIDRYAIYLDMGHELNGLGLVGCSSPGIHKVKVRSHCKMSFLGWTE